MSARKHRTLGNRGNLGICDFQDFREFRDFREFCVFDLAVGCLLQAKNWICERLGP